MAELRWSLEALDFKLMDSNNVKIQDVTPWICVREQHFRLKENKDVSKLNSNDT